MKIRLAAIVVLACSLYACVSSPVARPVSGEPTATSGGETQPAGSGVPNRIGDIEALHASAREAVAGNRLTEGIKLYITAMAGVKELDPTYFQKLNTEVQSVGARLTLEPDQRWLDGNGNMQQFSTRDIVSGRAPMPGVSLFENYGNSKAAVPDALIRFELVDTEGTLQQHATTDQYGLAVTRIQSLDSYEKPATIRAFPVFSSGGFSYAFREVFLDFLYIPAKPDLVVEAIEKYPQGERRAAESVTKIVESIHDWPVQVQQFPGGFNAGKLNSILAGKGSFPLGASGGTPTGTTDSMFLLAVSVEITEPVQLTLQGVKYNIYNSSGKVTVRLYRPDGSIACAFEGEAVRGQGGNPDAALADCRVRTAAVAAALVTTNSEVFRKALWN